MQMNAPTSGTPADPSSAQITWRDFVHLHVHSQYSVLDGGCHTKRLPARLAELGMDTVGLSDHGTMGGLLSFYLEMKNSGDKDKGIQPIRAILGCEIYMAEDRHHKTKRDDDERSIWHLGLIAMTTEGYYNMCEITSRAYMEGFYSKPRADWEVLADHSEGIIALTGCMGSPVMTAIFDGRFTRAYERVERLIKIFGAENVYGEIQNVGIIRTMPADSELARMLDLPVIETIDTKTGETVQVSELSQHQSNQVLVDLICKPLGIKYVATGDCHYLREEDADPHDALVCVSQPKKTLLDEKRFSLLPNKYFMRSAEQMMELLPDWPEALAETRRLANRCTAEIPIDRPMLPQYIDKPDGFFHSLVFQPPHKPGNPSPDIDLRPFGLTDEAGNPLFGAFIEEGVNKGLPIPKDIYWGLKWKGVKYTDRAGNLRPDITQERADVAAREVFFDRLLQQGSSRRFLRDLCEAGMIRRYGADWETSELGSAYRERLEFEFNTVDWMGFIDYFLWTWDIYAEAERRGIAAGPGRGSGAGSIMLYVLNVTQLCPIEYDLLFERFLNPDRISMPDVDMDFSIHRRVELIEYTSAKCNQAARVLMAKMEGKPIEEVHCTTATSQIITYGVIRAKAAIKDAARVLGHEPKLANAITKLVPAKPPTITLEKALEESPEIRAMMARDRNVKEIIDLAFWLEGFNRNESIHAAGVVIYDRPLETIIPLQQKRNKDGTPAELTTGYEMKYVEMVGALKMDFLGLRNLDVIEDAVEKIRHAEGIELSPYDIPVTDEKTYELLSHGDTAGIFQVESSGMQSSLRMVKPTKIEDINALVALYRPGPMKNIPTFAARKHGQEPVVWEDARLEEILGETYGICVSGEAQVLDVDSGQLVRLKDAHAQANLRVQGVDNEWNARIGRVTRWIDSGVKDVVRVRTRRGLSLELTPDHRVISDHGWVPIGELDAGSYIAVPHQLLISDQLRAKVASPADLAKARLLGMLLGDGGLTAQQLNFYSKSEELHEQFADLLDTAFGLRTCSISSHVGARGVKRSRIGKAKDAGAAYHSVSPLDDWLRSLQLRSKASERADGRCGPASEEKFVPEWAFSLGDEAIRELLAGWFDTDGHVGKKAAFIKTISPQLAEAARALLWRLGLMPAVYESSYRNGDVERTAYQISVTCDRTFCEQIGNRLTVTHKNTAARTSFSRSRVKVPAEAVRTSRVASGLTTRAYAERCGLTPVMSSPGYSERYARVLDWTYESIVNADLDHDGSMQRRLNTAWDEIVSIEPVGPMSVYDISVEGLQSFVANGIVVHNCTYQEQLMQMTKTLANFTAGEADNMRKAVGKKLLDKMQAMESQFVQGCVANGITAQLAKAIWERDFLPAADYSFNKCLAADTPVQLADGTRCTVDDLHKRYLTGEALQLMAMWPDGQLHAHTVAKVTDSGVRELLAVQLADGTRAEMTGDHRVLTSEGYLRADQLIEGVTRVLTASDAVREAVSETLPVSATATVVRQRLAGLAYQRSGIEQLRDYLTESAQFFLANPVTPNGRHADFLIDDVYWKVDSFDMSDEFYRERYRDLPYRVVAPEEVRLAVPAFQYGQPVRTGQLVTSIKPAGSARTLDVEMDFGGPRNFIAGTGPGLVSHNSHAACYGRLTYITAYLKRNHPHSYMAALLSSVMGTKDKGPLYLQETRRMGLPVLPPDVNRSLNSFTVIERDASRPLATEHAVEGAEKFEILVGLRAIKSVGDNVIEAIKRERESERGSFRSFHDFVRRMPDVNKTALNQLVRSGALDGMGMTRRGMFESVEDILDERRKWNLRKEREFLAETVILFAERHGEDPRWQGKRGLDTPIKRAVEAVAKLRHKLHELPDREEAYEKVLKALESADKAEVKKQLKKQELAAQAAERFTNESLEASRVEREAQAAELCDLTLALVNDVPEPDGVEQQEDLLQALEETIGLLDVADWPARERLQHEYDVLGIYISGHPLDEYLESWTRYISLPIAEISGRYLNQAALLAGVITGRTEQKYGRNKDKTFYKMQIDDFSGSREVTFFNEISPEVLELLVPGALVTVKARIKEDTFSRDDEETADASDEVAIKLDGLTIAIWKPEEVQDGPLLVQIPHQLRHQAKRVSTIEAILDNNVGDHLVLLQLLDENGTVEREMQWETGVNLTPQLMHALRRTLTWPTQSGKKMNGRRYVK